MNIKYLLTLLKFKTNVFCALKTLQNSVKIYLYIV